MARLFTSLVVAIHLLASPSGAIANPALRVIDERIAFFVNHFKTCQTEGHKTITKCFEGVFGEKTTRQMIACFSSDLLPTSPLSRAQRECVLDVSFTADQEGLFGIF